MTRNPSLPTPRPARRTSVRRRGSSYYLRGLPAATWVAAMAPGQGAPVERAGVA